MGTKNRKALGNYLWNLFHDDMDYLSDEQIAEILKAWPFVGKGILEIIERCSKVENRFEFFQEFGTITVPDDFVKGNKLDSLNPKDFYFLHAYLKEENFPNPMYVLQPGDKISVKAFRQNVKGLTSYEDRMVFLCKESNLFMGPYGAALLLSQKIDELISDYCYSSFDEKERLFKDPDGKFLLPSVDIDYRNGQPGFLLNPHTECCDQKHLLLCFNKV